MVGDPCTVAMRIITDMLKGLFITDSDKCLSPSLPFPTHSLCGLGGVVPQFIQEEIHSRRPSGDSFLEWVCCRVIRCLSFVPRFRMSLWLKYI